MVELVIQDTASYVLFSLNETYSFNSKENKKNKKNVYLTPGKQSECFGRGVW